MSVGPHEYPHEAREASLVPHYALMLAGERFPVECIPRDELGSAAIMAANRSAELSRDKATVVSLYVGERLLARWDHGRRVMA